VEGLLTERGVIVSREAIRLLDQLLWPTFCQLHPQTAGKSE